MPIENFLTEQELKSYVPELGRLLWSEETDFTPQKIQAYSELNNELSSRGFNPAEIMPRLYIRKAGITEKGRLQRENAVMNFFESIRSYQQRAADLDVLELQPLIDRFAKAKWLTGQNIDAPDYC